MADRYAEARDINPRLLESLLNDDPRRAIMLQKPLGFKPSDDMIAKSYTTLLELEKERPKIYEDYLVELGKAGRKGGEYEEDYAEAKKLKRALDEHDEKIRLAQVANVWSKYYEHLDIFKRTSLRGGKRRNRTRKRTRH